MNTGQIQDMLAETENRLREVREQEKTQDTVVTIVDRQEPLPRALFLDTNISAGGVRAYGVLASFFPTPFPGMRTLALYLGGADGAVRTTDELFLSGWVVKKIIRNSVNRQAVGTAYVLFPAIKMPGEMVTLNVGWIPFVIRLATPAAGKTDKKAALRQRATAIIKQNPKLFRGVFPISESVNSESVKGNESLYKIRSIYRKEPVAEGDGKTPAAQPSADGLSFESEFGFLWSPAHARFSVAKKYPMRGLRAGLSPNGRRKPPVDFIRATLWGRLCGFVGVQASPTPHPSAFRARAKT